MSYWSLLEESRRRLTAGDFLEAERLYYEAREDHRASRLRAPVMEKGVEPLLRGMRRIFGRPVEDEVGPAFPTAADRLLKDLQDVASLHLADTRRRTAQDWESVDLDASSRLGVALRMQRRSKLFRLTPEEHWSVLRAYLHGCSRHGMEINAELLDPRIELGEAECAWLADHVREQLLGRPHSLASAAAWLCAALRTLAREEAHPLQGEALALRCQLLLYDPLGAPLALREGMAALSAAYAPRDPAGLLRLVAGLRCNENCLASPVAGPDALHSLQPLASRFGISWPPAELEELLAQRSPDPALPTLAALAWEGGPGDRVVLLLQEGPAPVDVLILRPMDESGTADDPFASPMTEARARVEDWLAPGAPVLCGPTPPPWLVSLLGERPFLALEELETVLPSSRSRGAPAAAAARHPLLEDNTDQLCLPWRPLVEASRELGPRLLSLTALPALSADWGLRNLDSLGRVGVGLAHRLAHALRALTPAQEFPAPALDPLPGAAPLEWPRLVDRGWPGERAPNIQLEMPAGDLLIQGRPSAGELAGCALSAAPCVLIATDESQASRLAAGLVGHLDPRRITVAPSHPACPEAVFALLDDWIEESLVEVDRALDVLWLYQVLASAPESDLLRWLEHGGSPPARQAVSEALADQEQCHAGCRLAEAHECWSDQLVTRRRAAEVWVEWAQHLEAPAPLSGTLPRLVCDDLVAMIADADDETAMRRLDGLVDRAASVESLIAWSHSADFAEALVREFSQRLPEGRSFANLAASPASELSLHIAPPGYAPGASLLEEESRALVRARVQSWVRRSTPARAWLPPQEGGGAWKDVAGAHPLRGVGTRSHAAVVVALLAKPGPLDRVLALLRLSAAASHAQGELACVDPRLSELFPEAWALAPHARILTDPSPATEGRELLAKLPGRIAPQWPAPFDPERLAIVARRLGAARSPGVERLSALSEALTEFQRGSRSVLGGMLGDDRLVLAWTVAWMAQQSRDGGYLGARFVVWIGDADPDLSEGAPFSVVVAGSGAHGGSELGAALENGRIRLLVVPLRLLEHEDWVEWLCGLDRCLVLLPEADRSLDDHPARVRALEAFIGKLSAQSPRGRSLLACMDQADISPRGVLDRMAQQMDGRAVVVGSDPELASWRWQRVRLEDPTWNCSKCHKEQTLPHAHALCERCGEALLHGDADRAAAEQALRSSTVRWLSRRGMEQEWLVLAVDAQERELLLHDLGILPSGESAPLLGGSWSLRVVSLPELWREDPPDGELILTRLPDAPADLRAALSRLRSRGRVHGILHFMDHPLAWELPLGRREPVQSGTLPPLERMRYEAARAEVEFRARAALGRVERALRARSEGGGRLRRGLGPVADPREDARISSLAKAVEIWRSQAAEGLAVEQVQQQGSRRIAALLDDLEAAGFSFEELSPAGTVLSEIYVDAADREAARCVLRWLLAEGLLQTVESGHDSSKAVIKAPPSLPLLRWREAALSAPTGVATALPAWPSLAPPLASSSSSPESIEAQSGWILGVAGSGRTGALARRIGHADDGGRPASLVIVASEAGLLRWDAELQATREDSSPVLCVTLRELVLDFLRCHHEMGGFARPPRVLAAAASPDGEDLRRRLLRETSRRYAIAAGASPPVDLFEMRRVLEGHRLNAVAAAEGQSNSLDAGLLERCAAEARRDGAWVLPSELGALSRRWLVEHPYVGEAWRDRYPQVLVDDYDAMPEEERAFLDRLFPEGFRLATADPALLPLAHPRRGEGGARQSHRLPRELSRAAEVLLREEILGRGSIRARSREKGKLLRQPVLNLEACARRIEEALSGQQWQRQRVGLVLGYSGDLPWLASRLREAEIPVWPARQVVPACSPGPRDLLLVLALAGRGPSLEPLVAGSLAAALLEIAGIESSSLDHEQLGAWLGRLFAGEVGRAHHPAEAFLAPLAAVAPRLAERESLADAAAVLQGTHLLPRITRNEALASRLAAYVEERAEMPWRGVLTGLDPAGLVDPLAPGPRVWILEPEEMIGLELDRAFYLCTGHEPPEVHYRVLGRVRESLTVLYSEVDPFSPRR